MLFDFFTGLKNVPAIFKTVPLPAEIVLTTSISGTMDQSLMIEYLDKIIKPETENKPCLLIMDEFASHKTAMVNDFMTNSNICPLLIPGGYTSCLQPLDVAFNKPFKDHYRKEWSSWFIDPAHTVITPGGNRQRPSYVSLMQWLSNCHKALHVPLSIRKSFTTCGYYDSSRNGIAFIDQLNHRLKKILFVRNSGYDQSMKLSFLFTFNFPLLKDLLDELETYVAIYKGTDANEFSEIEKLGYDIEFDLDEMQLEQATSSSDEIPPKQATSSLGEMQLEQATSSLDEMQLEQATSSLDEMQLEQATSSLDEIPPKQADLDAFEMVDFDEFMCIQPTKSSRTQIWTMSSILN